ncbi:MAG TPA: hypothetical protein VFA89_18845 [Terriglobales bacterium]|nr:hypothetical protein [Terriglobales bacterium]
MTGSTAGLPSSAGIVRQIVDDVKIDSSRKSLSIDKELLEVMKLWEQKTEFSSESH